MVLFHFIYCHFYDTILCDRRWNNISHNLVQYLLSKYIYIEITNKVYSLPYSEKHINFGFNVNHFKAMMIRTFYLHPFRTNSLKRTRPIFLQRLLQFMISYITVNLFAYSTVLCFQSYEMVGCIEK